MTKSEDPEAYGGFEHRDEFDSVHAALNSFGAANKEKWSNMTKSEDLEVHTSSRGYGETLLYAAAPEFEIPTVEYNDGSHNTANTGKLSHLEDQHCDSESHNELRSSCELHQDVYSLIFLFNRRSTTFVVSSIIILLQYAILLLIAADLLEKEDSADASQENNKLKVPVYIDPTVVLAQYLAVIIAVVSQDDIVSTVNLISVGYDEEILKKFKTATYTFWVMACILRFLGGLLVLGVSFVFIVQAASVLDIFMNFAAVTFVADLDNVFFKFAHMGYLGDEMQRAADIALEIRLPLLAKPRKALRRGIILLTAAGLIVFLVILQHKQSSDEFLKGTSCAKLEVTFGEEVLLLQSPVDVSDTKRDTTLFAEGILEIPIPPPLVYAFFSGEYHMSNMMIENRPVYFERNIDDITSGMIYYCVDDKAWVFTIRALAYNLPGKDSCKHGWLLQSPVTDAFTLEEVGSDGWIVWTGIVQQAVSLSIQCNQCFRSSDCGLTNGHCSDSKECICNEGFAGKRCDMEVPFCNKIEATDYGESSFYFQNYAPLIIWANEANNSNITAYNRPVYYYSPDVNDGNLTEFVFFSGTRWLDIYWNISLAQKVLNPRKEYDHFHSYWHISRIPGGNSTSNSMKWFSDPSNAFTPTGSITWNEVSDGSSSGGSVDGGGDSVASVFGLYFPITANYQCTQSGCFEEPETFCGAFGTCNAGGFCDCHNMSGGHYCEFGLTSAYAAEQASELFAGFDDNFTNYYLVYGSSVYHSLFWSQYSADEWYEELSAIYEINYNVSF